MIARKFIKVAVDTFDHFSSHHGIQSAHSVSDPPQILARCWHTVNDHLPRAFESTQGVYTG